mmetsp:Transcript_772/g.1010  ORF Transcript_772/g.1010 Transcript_772/m.1010 type:complete len:404 (-) Transcript_772:477-1688(-)
MVSTSFYFNMEEEIKAIAFNSDPKAQTEAYVNLIDRLIDSRSAAELSKVVAHVLTDNVPLVVSRPAIQHLTSAVSRLKVPERMDVTKGAIDLVQTRLLSFEESGSRLREILSECLVEQDRYSEAARVLSHINMESGRYTDPEKAKFYVNVAELFLEAGETVEADKFLNRSAQVIHNCADENVRVRHKVSYARILDSKRKFLEAAQRYYELSTGEIQIEGQHVKEEELLHLLTKAVTCALLANAGPQRTRMLATLNKDQRAYNLTTHHPLLDKMYRERLLTRAEVHAFEHTLEPHQKAILADGSTVLERAVVEHNILAASRLYDNVLFSELGKLLEIDPDKAEQVASRMIGENRLLGSIDQVEGILEFGEDHDPLIGFDANIKRVCIAVNSCWEMIEKSAPMIF